MLTFKKSFLHVFIFIISGAKMGCFGPFALKPSDPTSGTSSFVK